jgi:hypothetical protein
MLYYGLMDDASKPHRMAARRDLDAARRILAGEGAQGAVADRVADWISNNNTRYFRRFGLTLFASLSKARATTPMGRAVRGLPVFHAAALLDQRDALDPDIVRQLLDHGLPGQSQMS